MTAGWRLMREEDLDAALEAADRIHPDYPERREVFAERLALHPTGCRVAEIDGRLVGYGVTHPWKSMRPPELDAALGAVPTDADVYYLHDIALLPAARGMRFGASALVWAEAEARAAGLAVLALTSTPGARGYWTARGFEPVAADKTLAAHLATYGEGMTHMTRRVAPR